MTPNLLFDLNFELKVSKIRSRVLNFTKLQIIFSKNLLISNLPPKSAPNSSLLMIGS